MRQIGVLPPLLAGLLVVTGVSAAQESGTVDAGERLVEDFLNRVTTMSGRFEQQLVDAEDNVVETSTGQLDIRRPGQFRWSYVQPYEQLLVADGVNMWSYDVDLEQVTVKPQADALGSTPAILLGGSSEVLADFEVLGSVEDRGTTWVNLRPRDTDSGFNRVELGFTDGELTRMLFGDNLEQTTLIALFDVVFNEPVDDEVFRFDVPAGVDVVGQPATSLQDR